MNFARYGLLNAVSSHKYWCAVSKEPDHRAEEDIEKTATLRKLTRSLQENSMKVHRQSIQEVMSQLQMSDSEDSDNDPEQTVPEFSEPKNNHSENEPKDQST